MIWLYWFAAALPWSAIALAWLVRARLGENASMLHARGGRSLAALPAAVDGRARWCFFTVSGNILATYVLPGLPAFALLVGDLWRPRMRTTSRALRTPVRALLVAGLALPVLFVAGIFVAHDRFERDLSHKALVRLGNDAREQRRASRLCGPASAVGRVLFAGQGDARCRTSRRLHRCSTIRRRTSSRFAPAISPGYRTRRAGSSCRSANSATTACCTKSPR